MAVDVKHIHIITNLHIMCNSIKKLQEKNMYVDMGSSSYFFGRGQTIFNVNFQKNIIS